MRSRVSLVAAATGCAKQFCRSLSLHRLTYLSILSFLLTLNFACATFDKTPNNNSASRAEAKSYEFKGKVISIDKAAKRVQIAHDDIINPAGGVYMEAMTMGFALGEPALYDELQAGDEVTGFLVVDKGRSLLENLSYTRPINNSSANPSNASTIPEPQIGASIPDFTLTNQNNTPLTKNDFRHHLTLVTFIYTRCPLPDYCPLMSENFAKIKNALRENQDLREKVKLLSISFDPSHDTPAVLRDYAERYYAKQDALPSWDFATGKPEQIAAMARFFGVNYETSSDGAINHTLVTALISPDGKLIKIYRGNDWLPAQVLNDIKNLHSAD